MTNRFSFTKEVLQRLPALPKRYYVHDTKINGLQLAVYESGAKTYFYYCFFKNKRFRIKIGQYDKLSIEQARKQAGTFAAQIVMGTNPQQEKIDSRKALTFKELFNIYYNEHALRFTKNPNANKKTMERHIFPKIGNDKAEEISTQKMRTLHATLASKRSRYAKEGEERRSEGNATRIITIVSAVFNFGIREEYIKCNNPCVGIKKAKPISRDRFLSFEEIASFFEALELEDKIYIHIFKTLLYTGARKTNVLKMKVSELDFSLQRWRIPETHTKNKDVNIVPLSQQAIEVLSERIKLNKLEGNESEYVFYGTGKDGHINDIKKSFNRIKERMEVYDIRIHDLRRTLGSYMAISGASLPIIGKALNHKSQISTAIYARLSQDPVLNAMDAATQLMLPKKLEMRKSITIKIKNKIPTPFRLTSKSATILNSA